MTIADMLNSRGISSVHGDWNKQKVRYMLSKPVYIGSPTYNRRGGSKWRQFENGQICDVPFGAKLGRKRPPEDHVAPSEPIFAPIVPLEIKGCRADGSRSSCHLVRPVFSCGRVKAIHGMCG